MYSPPLSERSVLSFFPLLLSNSAFHSRKQSNACSLVFSGYSHENQAGRKLCITAPSWIPLLGILIAPAYSYTLCIVKVFCLQQVDEVIITGKWRLHHHTDCPTKLPFVLWAEQTQPIHRIRPLLLRRPHLHKKWHTWSWALLFQ